MLNSATAVFREQKTSREATTLILITLSTFISPFISTILLLFA